MNKCVLCTFLKMCWDGLLHNTCPTVDKNKVDKKAKLKRGDFVFILIILLISFLFSFFGEHIVKLLAILFVWISEYGLYICGGAAGLFYLAAIGWHVIKWIKSTVACIKAYWRKAKEACE